MDVAAFGATCSPCSALFVKNLNAEEHAQEFPAAADAIIRKHYVDDYLDSADNVEEAVKLANEVKHVHSLGGFHLRNWLSNSMEVLARVGETDQATEKSLQLDKSTTTERVLGMYWKPDEDIFMFSTIPALNTKHPTKRQALHLWRAKTDWDELIPEKLCEKWTRWIELFRNLEDIRIPRCYFPYHSVNDIVSLQLHIYVDASEEAYACVGYLRAVFPDGIEVALVGGKSKVAPLKAQSIPRLELMAAVIGVGFSQTILNGHSLKIEKVFFWSDSKTVLAWINSDHRNYRQFVACRVGEIISKSNPEPWRWISTKKNVADEATKWGKGPCLSSNSRWFRGEDDLYLPEYQWISSVQSSAVQTIEELRSCMVHCKAVQLVAWERFSRWTSLVRAVGYVHRYAQNLRRTASKGSRQTGPLSQEELAKAETTIYRWMQRERYADEVTVLLQNKGKQLQEQQRLERTSVIRKLSPFLDESCIIRSDSRIAAATFVAYDTRYPIILPKEHFGTRLLVDWYHRRYLHANSETVVNEIKQRFHISQLRSLVRKVAKECTPCKVKKPSSPAGTSNGTTPCS
ncbi:uncharacterized protein LOC134289874 [Aedes albopictus]|uniref:Integrase zinc-binding domain-containing protein n=1 Tax=Aedes albopictus TaxID=7160 RepID=A0ABM1ZCF0_AEDAL